MREKYYEPLHNIKYQEKFSLIYKKEIFSIEFKILYGQIIIIKVLLFLLSLSSKETFHIDFRTNAYSVV